MWATFNSEVVLWIYKNQHIKTLLTKLAKQNIVSAIICGQPLNPEVVLWIYKNQHVQTLLTKHAKQNIVSAIICGQPLNPEVVLWIYKYKNQHIKTLLTKHAKQNIVSAIIYAGFKPMGQFDCGADMSRSVWDHIWALRSYCSGAPSRLISRSRESDRAGHQLDNLSISDTYFD